MTDGNRRVRNETVTGADVKRDGSVDASVRWVMEPEISEIYYAQFGLARKALWWVCLPRVE